MNFRPTDEQVELLRLFKTGEDIAVEAGAGAGKTSSLMLCASSTNRRGQYMAFNRAISDEAARKAPENLSARTVHSLAFRQVGKHYASRLNSGRMRSDRIAQLLGIDPFSVPMGEGKTKMIQPGHLGSLVMRAIVNYCQSADPSPTERHIPYVKGIDEPGMWANNDMVRSYLAPFLHDAWKDLCDPDGSLPYRHDHYVKQWERENPLIHADYVVVDEAQDLSPVMLSIVMNQAKHAQIVLIGDGNQSIYSWRGCVNAMQQAAVVHRAYLTRSFRFGQEIADVANVILSKLDTVMRLQGTPKRTSSVTDLDDARAVLCRTNATAVRRLFSAVAQGKHPTLLGGGGDVLAFADAARDLKQGKRTSHPDLMCFESWGEVQSYVAEDPSGDEIALLVKLVDDYGPDLIIHALGHAPNEAEADVVLSTAHKAKGREWPSVVLAEDFDESDQHPLSDEEMRLLYVACTRAQESLDPYSSAPMRRLLGYRVGLAS